MDRQYYTYIMTNKRNTVVYTGITNDPNGISLVSITPDLGEQTNIIKEYMIKYIDGVECWHSRHDAKATSHYLGTLDIPDYVAEQFQ